MPSPNYRVNVLLLSIVNSKVNWYKVAQIFPRGGSAVHLEDLSDFGSATVPPSNRITRSDVRLEARSRAVSP